MLEEEKSYIKKAKQGERGAFGLLYNHYLPQIYRFVFLKVGTRAEAEDLVHEIFLSAWQNIPNYKEKGFPFSSWLYQIARNAVIDFYRTAKKNIQIETVSEELIKIDNQEIKSLDTSLELKKIRNSISLLKSDYQDVLIMRFIEDMTNEEVACAMHKSEGAIRLLQHRAIKELKSLYENNNPNYGTTIKEV